MRLGKDLINKPIFSIDNGQLLGQVRDIFVNQELYWLTGIHLGSEGLVRRKTRLIRREDVVVFGLDAILVKNAQVVTDDRELEEAESWLRLDSLQGRQVDTPGGTKVAIVGDVILSEEGHIDGFTLSRVHVEGPIARERTVMREVLVDTGQADGVMTVDLLKLEKLYVSDKDDETPAEPAPAKDADRDAAGDE